MSQSERIAYRLLTRMNEPNDEPPVRVHAQSISVLFQNLVRADRYTPSIAHKIENLYLCAQFIRCKMSLLANELAMKYGEDPRMFGDEKFVNNLLSIVQGGDNIKINNQLLREFDDYVAENGLLDGKVEIK